MGFKIYKEDISASFVVFLVALPLSIGIALASGAPMQSGLIAAIVGGIVGGSLAGAPLQVSGPAAGLTVMVLQIVQRLGFEQACTVFVGAGVIQLIMGFTGLSRLALLIAPSVLHAMLAGIGILIAFAQFFVFLGGKPAGAPLENMLHLPGAVASANWITVLTGATCIAVLYIWNRGPSQKIRWLPGSLVAIVVATIVSKFLPEQPLVSISSQLFQGFHIPNFGAGSPISDIAVSALGLAIVASAESLLCAVASDKLHTGKKSNLDRELMAQGVSNTLSGLLYGLPVTGVIVRSSANISAGAKSRWSAILHGVWMLVFSVALSGVIGWIPLAALAALLIWIGVHLIKLHEIKTSFRYGEGWIYVVTLAGVVFMNLLWGIGFGICASILALLYRMRKVSLTVESGNDRVVVGIKGALTFVSVPKLLEQLSRIDDGKSIDVRFDLYQLDIASIEAIRDWKSAYERKGGNVTKEPLEDLWRRLTLKA